MRLVLKPAAPWIAATPVDGESLAFTRADAPIRLHTTELYDRFAPGEPRQASRELDAVSTLGWPARIIELEAPNGSRALEVRYELFELGGAAVATGPKDSIAHHRDELLAVLLAGSPDWGGEIACLADLLAGLTDRA